MEKRRFIYQGKSVITATTENTVNKRYYNVFYNLSSLAFVYCFLHILRLFRCLEKQIFSLFSLSKYFFFFFNLVYPFFGFVNGREKYPHSKPVFFSIVHPANSVFFDHSQFSQNPFSFLYLIKSLILRIKYQFLWLCSSRETINSMPILILFGLLCT